MAWWFWVSSWPTFEPPHDKTNRMACAPREDSDQPGHPPSLTRVFAVRMKKAWVLSYPLNAQRRLWSDWADAQADLSLRWAHSHCVGFVMRRLIYVRFKVSIYSHVELLNRRAPHLWNGCCGSRLRIRRGLSQSWQVLGSRAWETLWGYPQSPSWQSIIATLWMQHNNFSMLPPGR